MDAIVVSPTGVIVTAGRDGLVMEWTELGARVLYRAEGTSVPRLAGTREALVGGTGLGALVWIDWRTGALIREAQLFEEAVTSLAARSDGTMVATGDDDAVVVVRADGSELGRGSTYKWPYHASISLDQRRAIIASWDASLYEISLDEPFAGDDLLPELRVPYPGMPFYAALEVDPSRLVIATQGELVRGNGASLALWTRGADAWDAYLQTPGVLALAFSPDRSVLAAGGYDGVRFLDPASLREGEHVDVEASYSWGGTPVEVSAAYAGDDLGRRLARLGLSGIGLEGVVAPSPHPSTAVPTEHAPYTGATAHTVACLAWSDPARLLAGTFGGDVLSIPVG
ncbi:MAG: hypothetical protein KC619_13185 [Myxococcales bacterium]|nr:hypothetical protein [Myxococcales bacterium]